MNISDFAAKGAKPLAVLVSLGLPASITKKDVEQIGNGLNAGAREYGTFVIGGDTGEATDLIISVMVFGLVCKEKVILRSGAKPDDILAVTGLFGKTSAGLRLLLGDYKASKSVRDALVDSVYMPSARLREGLALAHSEGASASIDSSDGLAWSLHEIGRGSHVGFVIGHVPVAEEAKKFAIANKLDVWDLTFYGGEEYELVVTVKPELWKKTERAVGNVGGQLLRIGKVTADKQVFVKVGGERHDVEPRGYEHFIHSI
jgi:thiamine-monophosphate kinase